MVGSALLRRLDAEGYSNVVSRSSAELDLRRQSAVSEFFEREKPEIVIVAAARVGGILANDTYRAEFIYDNLLIEANLIDAAYKNSVEKLVFLGSSCIYPRLAPQPMREETLLSGPLESTNEPYAIAKIAGIKLCENYYRQYGCDFFSVMPTNLYGPNDNFNIESSHVIPGLIRKFHIAKDTGAHEVSVWGSGAPLREFMFVDDLADAIVFILEDLGARDIYSMGISHINVGSGFELAISDLAEMIKGVVGYEGKIVFDGTKPDGTPRKLLDSSRLNRLGWRARTSLEDGLKLTYDWFLNNTATAGLRAAAES